MTNAAQWAVAAENKFREVARTATNPSTTLLAEGLAHLAEAIRALDDDVQHAGKEIKSMRQPRVTAGCPWCGHPLESGP